MFLFLGCLFFFFFLVHAHYFYVTEGTERCLITEVISNTYVHGRYRLLSAMDTPDHMKIRLSVREPDTGSMLMVQDMEDSGHFAFSARRSGEHRICMATNITMSNVNPLRFKVMMRMDSGEHAMDYSLLATKHQLSAILLEILKLKEQMRLIKGNVAYDLLREKQFRDISENTHERIDWFGTFCALLCLGKSIFAIYHLKRFFANKKLI